MTCDVCGQRNARIRRVSRDYGRGERLLVIENVPVVSCPDCGEAYLTADTLHEIERIKRHRKTLSEKPNETHEREGKMDNRVTRRKFIETTGKGAVVVAAVSSAAPAVLAAKSPNAEIGVGHIGLGVRGGRLIQQVAGTPGKPGIEGARVVAVCDVYKPHLQKGVDRSNNPSVRTYSDYRELLADPAVDVVVIAVPDHWHARMTIDAANAGKDVYIEKCWTHTIPEALETYAAIKKNKTVMQLGHNGRENPIGIAAGEIIRKGILGPVTFVRCGLFRNREWGKDEWRWFGDYGQYEKPDPKQVERDLDWKSWLGSAPARPFDFERFWHWRCYWDYGTGIAGDLLSHEFDYMQYILGYGIPETCVCSGQIGLLKDGREAPDIWNVIYEYPKRGLTLTYCCTFNSEEFGQSPEFRGKDAILRFTDYHNDFAVYAERTSKRYRPRVAKGEIKLGEPFMKYDPASMPPQPSHMQDFINCVRSRGKPKCNEDEALVEAVTSIMSVISYKEGRRVRWDPVKKKVV